MNNNDLLEIKIRVSYLRKLALANGVMSALGLSIILLPLLIIPCFIISHTILVNVANLKAMLKQSTSEQVKKILPYVENCQIYAVLGIFFNFIYSWVLHSNFNRIDAFMHNMDDSNLFSSSISRYSLQEKQRAEKEKQRLLRLEKKNKPITKFISLKRNTWLAISFLIMMIIFLILSMIFLFLSSPENLESRWLLFFIFIGFFGAFYLLSALLCIGCAVTSSKLKKILLVNNMDIDNKTIKNLKLSITFSILGIFFSIFFIWVVLAEVIKLKKDKIFASKNIIEQAV